MAKKQPTHPMKRIFNEVFRNVDLDNERNIEHLPNLKNIENSVYLSRASRLPRMPHSRVEVQLEGEWRRTVDGRDFILAIDGEDDRLIIQGDPKKTGPVYTLCAFSFIYSLIALILQDIAESTTVSTPRHPVGAGTKNTLC